jgi:hypothetical protein
LIGIYDLRSSILGISSGEAASVNHKSQIINEESPRRKVEGGLDGAGAEVVNWLNGTLSAGGLLVVSLCLAVIILCMVSAGALARLHTIHTTSSLEIY